MDAVFFVLHGHTYLDVYLVPEIFKNSLMYNQINGTKYWKGMWTERNIYKLNKYPSLY